MDPILFASILGQAIRRLTRGSDGEFLVELESGLRIGVETDHGTRLRILAPT